MVPIAVLQISAFGFCPRLKCVEGDASVDTISCSLAGLGFDEWTGYEAHIGN